MENLSEDICFARKKKINLDEWSPVKADEDDSMMMIMVKFLIRNMMCHKPAKRINMKTVNEELRKIIAAEAEMVSLLF